MDAVEITGARWKAVLYLGISLAFVAIALFVPHADHEVWKAQLCVTFFGLCSAIFIRLLIRPQRLLLDGEGFIVTGGLVRAPRKVYWRDIDEFFVYRFPRGGKMIAFDYQPGARDDSTMLRISRRIGAEGALPMGWAKSSEKMVAALNAYRLRALDAGSPTQNARGRREPQMRVDRASRQIAAPAERIYQALTDWHAVERWLPPEGARGIVEAFEPRAGGAFRMTLVFDAPGETGPGKSTENTDVVEGEFLELTPNELVRQRFTFKSDDPAFAGAMVMTWTLTAAPGGTLVAIAAENVPVGISAQDHQDGLTSSLANLAGYVE